MPKAKTLNRVEQLRKRLGFAPGEMADLLGVNVATLYRWESSEGKLNIDPLQNKILEYIHYRFFVMTSEHWTESGVEVWILALKQCVTIGGTLKGLSYLLKPLSDHA